MSQSIMLLAYSPGAGVELLEWLAIIGICLASNAILKSIFSGKPVS